MVENKSAEQAAAGGPQGKIYREWDTTDVSLWLKD